MNYLSISFVAFGALALVACGGAPAGEESCGGRGCTEAELHAPAPGEQAYPPNKEVDPDAFRMPSFRESWEMKRNVYDAAVAYYKKHSAEFAVKRYVVVIDFSQHSSKRRWYLFDLETRKVERYLTTHGKNSDPDDDGLATEFSNTPESLQSSLGAYRTLHSYDGKYGYSMRLDGLEESNSNAQPRAIVVHPATYVSEKDEKAGRSWGCPALDKTVSKKIIDRIKDGALLYIGN